MSFEKYYNLFSQKKNRFKMKNAFLMNVIKININYFTQLTTLMYRVSKINQRSITFDEHVIMWLKTNRDLRQIRHIVLKISIISIVIITLLKKSNSLFMIFSTIFFIKAFALFLIFFFLLINDSMNLSSIMTAIKN
jgi:hypothetical protein